MIRHFGQALRVLHWCMDQSVTNTLARLELTASQGRVMGYLAHRKSPACSRDIEEEFQLSHPTVSGLLSRLEKKGFIEFRPDEADRRCRRIYILPKGWECHDLIHRTITENEARLVQDFTPEEKELFREFLLRAIRNMGVQPCCKDNKEEHKE